METVQTLVRSGRSGDCGGPSGAHVAERPERGRLSEGDAVLEDVPFGAVSQYLDVPAGERSVEITAAGDPDTSVFSGPVAVEADTAYTIAAVGEIGDDADQAFEPLVLEDDNSDPGGDTARVRLVHASPDAPAVDVTLASNGDALYDGVEYGGSGYVEVPSGTIRSKYVVTGEQRRRRRRGVRREPVRWRGDTAFAAATHAGRRPGGRALRPARDTGHWRQRYGN